MSKRISIITVLLCISAVVCAFEPASSPFYEFAERIHHTVGLKSFSYTRPYSRQIIVDVLREINEKRESLPYSDKGILDYYIEKYYHENAATSLHKPFHLIDYIHENGTLTLDLVGRGGFLRGDFDKVTMQENDFMVYTSGITFRGTLGNHWDYYCFFVDETLNGFSPAYDQRMIVSYLDEDDNPVEEFIYPIEKFVENGGFGWVNYQSERKEMYFDQTRAYMTYSFPFGFIEFGKNTNSWGPGVQSHVMISDNAAPYVQFKTHFTLGKFRLTSTTAQLRTNELDPNTKIETEDGDVKFEYRKKYIASHRLEMSLSSKVMIALTESVIYADKNVQLGYAIPFNIFWSEQHYQGDRDNTAIGMEVSVTPINRVSVYGELFFDDISFQHLTDFRRTKAAYIAGIKWYPEWLPTSRIVCEYSRVNPIVYTHRFNVDNFTHAQSNIGSFLYPNSDYIHFSVSGALTSRLSYRVYADRVRHGLNYIDNDDHYRNVGGDMYRPDTLSNGHSIEQELAFLDGIVETEKKIGLNLTYRVDVRSLWRSIGLYDLFLDAGVEMQSFTRSYPSDAREKPVVDDNIMGLYFMVRYHYE